MSKIMREIMKNEEDNELVYDENQRQYIASEKKRIKEAEDTLEILSKQEKAS
jgi:hypothetical protein